MRKRGGAAGRKAGALTALLAMVWLATESRASVTLVEGEKGRLELETRFMFWAVDNGPEAQVSKSPDLDDNIYRLSFVVVF